MNDLSKFTTTLPALAINIGPLEGENLDPSALILRHECSSAEQAIVNFRAEHTPERLPYYRHYWLKARNDGRVAVIYSYNLKRPKTDRVIGVVPGDDEAAIRVLIGNDSGGKFMTPIKWVLFEDRDGADPVATGRFDFWSLLQGVDAHDLERLHRRDMTISAKKWDFDLLYLWRTCPRCQTPTSINLRAFNIDSARCAKCGIRPFLSRALGQRLSDVLPDITGECGNTDEMARTLANSIKWLAGVNASPLDLHPEKLPSGWTPHQMLVELMDRTRLLEMSPTSDASGQSEYLPVITSAAPVLQKKIRDGRPLDEVDAALMNFLRALHASKG